MNGRKGYYITGPNGHMLFLPTYDFSKDPEDDGSSLEQAEYWSGNPSEDNAYADICGFTEEWAICTYPEWRWIARFVRPVADCQ